MDRRTFLATSAGGLAVALSGCAGADVTAPGEPAVETLDRSLPLDGATRLAVDGRVGNVTVRQTGGSGVALRAEKRSRFGTEPLEDVQVRTEREGDRLVVRVVHDRAFQDPSPVVDVDLGVPAGLVVERVAVEVGDVDVEGVAGPLSVESIVGDVRVGDVSEDVAVVGDVGDVAVERVGGFVAANTFVGTVAARDVGGFAAGGAEFGNVAADVPALRDDAAVETILGDVALWLAPDLDARLEVRTAAGRIDAEGFALVDTEEGPGSLTGRLGGGAHRLAVRCEEGDVTLRELPRS